MRAVNVVITIYPLIYIAYCMAKFTITTFRKPFTFNTAKDSLNWRIILEISSATHTLYYAISPE